MTENHGALLKLLEPFPAEQVGKLPRVTCSDCSDRRKTCQQHSKKRCDVCKAWVSERHIHLDYVGHADVTKRLLDVDLEWDWEPLHRDIDPQVLAAAVATGNPEIVAAVLEAAPPKFDLDDRDNPVGLWIKLTVCGVTRSGYGSVPSDQKDAVKVLIGDALRNAAMRFGVALDLWAKGDRADPADQNATAAGGTAARRRQPAQRPVQQRTDHDWLTSMEGRINVAANRGELTKLAREITAKQAAGQCEQVHADHLWELGKQRQHALGIAVNKDGSLSRSRMSDEALAREGAMTKQQAKEHNALRRDGEPAADQIERRISIDENDPWATAGTPSGELPEEPEGDTPL